MKTVLITLLAAGIVAASASAAPVDWTKAGAISAVTTAPIWKDTSGGPGAPYALFRASHVTSAVPYGKTRRVNGKVRAAMWDMTLTMTFKDQTYTNKLCVKALGPVRTAAPFTAFQIGSWVFQSTAATGGCAHYATSGQGGSEWGGSKAVLTHP